MSTNKSKVPLDKEYLPRPSMVVKTIDMNEKLPEQPIPTGVKLVEVNEFEQTISDEELKMSTETNINDITDFGEFMPTQVIALEDATDFPTLDGNQAIIQDSEEPKKSK